MAGYLKRHATTKKIDRVPPKNIPSWITEAAATREEANEGVRKQDNYLRWEMKLALLGYLAKARAQQNTVSLELQWGIKADWHETKASKQSNTQVGGSSKQRSIASKGWQQAKQ